MPSALPALPCLVFSNPGQVQPQTLSPLPHREQSQDTEALPSSRDPSSWVVAPCAKRPPSQLARCLQREGSVPGGAHTRGTATALSHSPTQEGGSRRPTGLCARKQQRGRKEASPGHGGSAAPSSGRSTEWLGTQGQTWSPLGIEARGQVTCMWG